MTRRQPNTEDQDRRALLDAAVRLLGAGRGELVVLLVRGDVLTIRPEMPPTEPGAFPAEMSQYDRDILRALAGRPLSSQQLARRARHRHNSYFRERLAAIVEAGHIRHTRRGYMPGG